MAAFFKKRALKNPGNYGFFSKFTYYVPGVADLFILLVFLLVGVLLGNLVSLLFGLFLDQKDFVEYAMLVSYPLMFIPPMIYAGVKSAGKSFNNQGVRLDSNHFKPMGGLVCALLATVATLALGFCSDAITSAMPQMPEWLETIMESMTSGTLWINILCVSIFAPLFEEWLCRGMVLRGLLGNGVKPIWAIVISAAFFALIHMNPWQAVPAFLLGLLFGYVYFRTGSLKLTMLMHCVNNSFALLFSNIPAFKDMESWRDIFSGPEYWIIMASCLILSILSVLAFNKIALVKESGNSDSVPALFGRR